MRDITRIYFRVLFAKNIHAKIDDIIIKRTFLFDYFFTTIILLKEYDFYIFYVHGFDIKMEISVIINSTSYSYLHNNVTR